MMMMGLSPAGMVLPLINMTIKGATWFQGENNCAECDARCSVNGTNPKTGLPSTIKDCTDSSLGETQTPNTRN